MFNLNILFCSTIVLSVLFTYFKWLYKRYRDIIMPIDKLPGPTAWPIFGNLLQLGFKPDEYFKNVMRWIRANNFKTFRIWAGPLPYVILLEPKHVEHVLSSNTLTYKYDPYNLLYPWLGNGLLTANAKNWSNKRKLLTPSFHFRILKDFLHVMNETTDRFMLLLDKYATNMDIIDFQKIVTRSTVDVICETAMGTRMNSIEGKQLPIVQAMDVICYIVPERVFSVFKRFDFCFRLTSLYKAQCRALKILKAEFAKIIEQRRSLIASDNYNLANDDDLKRPKMAFLDNLLTAEIDDRPLNFQEIFEEVSTFMFEGHDTTASALTFSAYCLSRHPHVQQRAYEEQLSIYGTEQQRRPTYQELQDMKYLELVIKEALRLFPSVPFIFRTAKESLVIDEHYLPQGSTLAIPIVGLGQDPNSYERPYEFRPERFEANARFNTNPFNYVPFSAGPRNCIGQKFAMLELKVTLSKLLHNFELLPPVEGLSSGIAEAFDPKHVPKGYDLQLHIPLTLKSMNGVHMRLKRRTQL